jgi:hypothetical protein
LLSKPFHATDGIFGFNRLRFSVPRRLRELTGVFEDALAGERALEPIQKLCGGIDLVVVLTVGEHRQLVEVFGEPRSVLRDADIRRRLPVRQLPLGH